MKSFDLAKHTLLSTTAGLLLALGVSVAPGTASAKGIILACVHNTTGALRVRGPDPCKSNETQTFWNRRGPQGDTGADGAPGPQGPAGADAELPVRCPCRFESAIPASPITGPWGAPATIKLNNLPQSPTTLDCNLSSKIDLSASTSLQSSIDTDGEDHRCGTLQNGDASDSTNVLELSLEEALACNRDINDYALSLHRITNLSVSGIDNLCPEVP